MPQKAQPRGAGRVVALMIVVICVVCSPGVAWLVAEAPLQSSGAVTQPPHPIASAPRPATSPHPAAAVPSTSTTTTSTTTTSTTTSNVASSTTTTTTTPGASPETGVVQPEPAIPSVGTATQYGCAAALAYLAAYAAPGFSADCPGNAAGHQAETQCDPSAPTCETGTISIADPCPAAYMNEASNSWVLSGASSQPIDPYGACT